MPAWIEEGVDVRWMSPARDGNLFDLCCAIVLGMQGASLSMGGAIK